MRLLDLFSGIGGFSLAARWVGWQTVAFVEKEPFCQDVLRKNFGDIPIYNDITTFSGKPFRGHVDIISGGFPCQPFSVAGSRKGDEDERHLFPEMLRVISKVKPRWVVAENVRGLLSISNGRVYSEVIASLERIGYEVVTFCIPASAVESPHRRDRLWIVAHAKDDTANTQLSASDASHIGRIGRPNGSQDRERSVYPRRGDDRLLSEPAISYQNIAGFDLNANRIGLQREWQELDGAGSPGLRHRENPGWRTGLRLQSAFAEWMMGFPLNWTSLEHETTEASASTPSETP